LALRKGGLPREAGGAAAARATTRTVTRATVQRARRLPRKVGGTGRRWLGSNRSGALSAPIRLGGAVRTETNTGPGAVGAKGVCGSASPGGGCNGESMDTAAGGCQRPRVEALAEWSSSGGRSVRVATELCQTATGSACLETCWMASGSVCLAPIRLGGAVCNETNAGPRAVGSKGFCGSASSGSGCGGPVAGGCHRPRAEALAERNSGGGLSVKDATELCQTATGSARLETCRMASGSASLALCRTGGSTCLEPCLRVRDVNCICCGATGGPPLRRWRRKSMPGGCGGCDSGGSCSVFCRGCGRVTGGVAPVGTQRRPASASAAAGAVGYSAVLTAIFGWGPPLSAQQRQMSSASSGKPRPSPTPMASARWLGGMAVITSAVLLLDPSSVNSQHCSLIQEEGCSKASCPAYCA